MLLFSLVILAINHQLLFEMLYHAEIAHFLIGHNFSENETNLETTPKYNI